MTVIVVLSGGLGNQLFQYSAGRALAIRAGTDLCLDLRFFIDKASHSKHAWILDFPLVAKNIIYRSRFSAHGLPRRLWRKIVEAPRVFNGSLGFDRRFNSLGGDSILHGLFQSYRYFEAQFSKFGDEIDPINLPQFFQRSLAAELALTNKVGVHVRRGDYLTHALFAMTDYREYYQKVVAEVRAAGDRLVVFSDDIEWCRQQDFFEGSIFYPSDESIPPYYDLGAMSCCKKLYIANSTFSWWAGWLGTKRGAEVIAPANWILNHGTAKLDLAPNRWRLFDE